MQGEALQCALVSDFTTGRSYGTLSCQSCQTQAVCLVTDSKTQLGKCSCLQQGLVLQTCQVSELLQTIFTDPTALCGMSVSAASTRTVSPYIPWSAMSVVPCALVQKANTQCYRTDTQGYVVVGHGSIDTTLLGRRLLSYEQETHQVWALESEIAHFDSWNHTAEPCRMLANSYVHGGHLAITEEASLIACVQNRQFGNFTINALNLTRLEGQDHFIMSFFDFVTVVSQRGVLRQLLNTTGLFHFVATQSNVLRPWVRAYKSLAVSVITMFAQDARKINRVANTTNTTTNQSAWSDAILSSQLSVMHLIDPLSTRNLDIHLDMNTIYLPDTSLLQSIAEEVLLSPSTTIRRLLQEPPTTDPLGDVFRYSSMTAVTDGYSNIPLG